MKWHDHPLVWRTYSESEGVKPDHNSAKRLADKLITPKYAADGGQNTAALICQEWLWFQAKRPYYDLYPSIGEAFTKVDLDKIRCEQIKLPIPQIMIRTQIDHELQFDGCTKIRTILAAETPAREGGRGWLIAWNDGRVLYPEEPSCKIPLHGITAVRMIEGDTIAQHLSIGRERDNQYGIGEGSLGLSNKAVDNIFRLVVALCLLKDNPDLIEPEPLDADREKWEKTHDPKLLEKAEKRGKRAWAIGKHIEVAPGFRRPHFAIRWCGKGGTDPQLRPIKGCLVRREKVTEVPTDYLDRVQEE